MAQRFNKFTKAPVRQNWIAGLFGNNGGDGGSAAPAPAPAPAPSPAPAPAPAPVDPVSQLDQFKTLWQTPTDAEGKPLPLPADPLAQPLLNLDPKVIQQSASKLDFAGAIPAELLTKIAAGGQEAAEALPQILNAAIQQAVAGITLNQGQLLNQALVANNQRVSSVLPGQIRRTQAMDFSEEEDPVLKHPQVQPLVQSLIRTAFAKDPNADPAKVRQEVAGYLRGIGAAMHETSPEVQASRKAAIKGEQDWSGFFE